MHQYSAAKAKKIEDAAMWFEKCETVLMDAVDLPDYSDIESIENVVSTPLVLMLESGASPGYDIDASPLVQKKGTELSLLLSKSSD